MKEAKQTLALYIQNIKEENELLKRKLTNSLKDYEELHTKYISIEAALAGKDADTQQLKLAYARTVKRLEYVQNIKGSEPHENRSRISSLLQYIWKDSQMEKVEQKHEKEKEILCEEITRLVKEIELLKKDNSIGKKAHENSIEKLTKERDECATHAKRNEIKVANKKDKIKQLKIKIQEINQTQQIQVEQHTKDIQSKEQTITELNKSVLKCNTEITATKKSLNELTVTNSQLRILVDEAANKLIAQQGPLVSKRASKIETNMSNISVFCKSTPGSITIDQDKLAIIKKQNKFIKDITTKPVMI